MIVPGAELKIYIATRPVDFRCGHDGLVAKVQGLERCKFVWPKIADGVMRISPATFAALFEGLDWRLVRPEEARRPQIAG
ncbi:hypothetical protein GPL17_36495 [Bradyrhizobium yuanmingense]|uniref:hypothetical protein n=1 Tax=Bradyrhizobium yuanmingense TaxID=108015 RepID=UPI0012FC3D8A|nr:hypothetical protein [Bradyrhizobium yuanmingense]MVT55893.1 hypothetical protein [Bradyrhizobium yuanmingense]